MNERAGMVQVDGLYEGPTSAWCPTQEQLQDALRRAGAPDNLLQLVIKGGRAALEPADLAFPRGQFAGDPGGCLSLALEFLIEETLGSQPEDWFCSLRTTEYRESLKVETLLQVHPDGIRGVVREQPWQEATAVSWPQKLREQWILLTLVLIAFAAGAYLKREQGLKLWQSLFADKVVLAEAFSPSAGPFAKYLQLEVAANEDGDELIITLRQAPAFPQDEADWEAAQAQASGPEQEALDALRKGKLNLQLSFSDDLLAMRKLSLQAWAPDGSQAFHFDGKSPWRGHQLLSASLRP